MYGDIVDDCDGAMGDKVGDDGDSAMGYNNIDGDDDDDDDDTSSTTSDEGDNHQGQQSVSR